jgi:hypothetical protein
VEWLILFIVPSMAVAIVAIVSVAVHRNEVATLEKVKPRVGKQVKFCKDCGQELEGKVVLRGYSPYTGEGEFRTWAQCPDYPGSPVGRGHMVPSALAYVPDEFANIYFCGRAPRER